METKGLLRKMYKKFEMPLGIRNSEKRATFFQNRRIFTDFGGTFVETKGLSRTMYKKFEMPIGIRGQCPQSLQFLPLLQKPTNI